jgi:plastocyanin
MFTRDLQALACALALAGGVLAGGLLLETSAAAQPAAGPIVKIDNFTFGPPVVTVGVGTTVTWVNQDDIPHTVVANDHTFKSKVMDTDEKFSFTFTKPGEYGYFCSLHPHMTGKVVVRGG